MASLLDALTAHLPMEQTHQKYGIENPLLKFLLDPLTLGGLAGVGVGAATARGLGRRAGAELGDAASELYTKVARPRLFPGRSLSQLRSEAGTRLRRRLLAARQDIDPTSSILRIDKQVLGGTSPDLMDVLHTTDTPIYDWDLGPAEAGVRSVTDDLAHPDMATYVENLAEVLDIARQRASRLKAANVPSNLRLYLTPGGYRGIETGVHAVPKAGFSGVLRPDKVDPTYAAISKRPSVAYSILDKPPEPSIVMPEGARYMSMSPSYAARVSAKPGRDPSRDWIAGLIGGVSTEEPVSSAMKITRLGHDLPIAGSGVVRGDQRQAAFLEAVAKELPNLSPEDRNVVTRILVSRYGIPISAIPGLMLSMRFALGDGKND